MSRVTTPRGHQQVKTRPLHKQHFFVAVVILVLAVVAAGCRQVDGPILTPTESLRDEIGDVAQDVLNVANQNPQAPQELADDLRKFSPTPEAEPQALELARRISDVLPGRTVSEHDAEGMARALWLGISARELSGRQVESLQDELHVILVSAGAPEEGADSVTAQLGEVQKIVTMRTKRWYELF